MCGQCIPFFVTLLPAIKYIPRIVLLTAILSVPYVKSLIRL
jgi:hypothetical protein